jgi:hypothetical protein
MNFVTIIETVARSWWKIMKIWPTFSIVSTIFWEQQNTCCWFFQYSYRTYRPSKRHQIIGLSRLATWDMPKHTIIETLFLTFLTRIWSILVGWIVLELKLITYLESASKSESTYVRFKFFRRHFFLEGEGEIELPRPVSTVTQAVNLQAVYD